MKVLSLILAGGEGKRLMPLTEDRAKPAVPFAGSYRLIDFALSNLINSGFLKCAVLTQYKSHSLDRHISLTWRMSSMLGNYVTPVPAQQRRGKQWYQGSADAIYQSMNLIIDERPDIIVVFGADHVYRMNARQMVDAHIASGAGVTVAGIRVPRSQANQFGVMTVKDDGTTIDEFLEKPADPPGLPDSPDEVLASMGNYVFTADVLIEALEADAKDPASLHDMGGDIVPAMVAKQLAAVYDFKENEIPGSIGDDRFYWRDVGTIDSYHDAHLDLVSASPEFNLYNQEWPIYSLPAQLPGAKFVHGASVRDSIVCAGSIVSGANTDASVIGTGVRVDDGAAIQRTVLMDGVHVGRGAILRDAIVDKNVVIPPRTLIGIDHEEDRRRGFHVSEGGIVVIGKGQLV
ncbi:glucose-1-phosphate adenylyltransferase [Nocardioides phosphati]|uniref:Glucose-1-phosphate adenylyltransferase n=1 Tax=Nocardioides phosphati TaxID=1867775 RepID=A0ABQ2N4Z3_9ACTN|nr:glucose-1-phosphate adenylyltransferase [Nocardioides phosphati]GGO84587.1 glucose-1-phosphate adenylyltransferase [Nocardioides phosphati]